MSLLELLINLMHICLIKALISIKTHTTNIYHGFCINIWRKSFFNHSNKLLFIIIIHNENSYFKLQKCFHNITVLFCFFGKNCNVSILLTSTVYGFTACKNSVNTVTQVRNNKNLHFWVKYRQINRSSPLQRLNISYQDDSYLSCHSCPMMISTCTDALRYR